MCIKYILSLKCIPFYISGLMVIMRSLIEVGIPEKELAFKIPGS